MRGIFRAGRAADASLPRTGIHRILVCRSVHTLGDSLTLTPLLAELATTWPGAEVDVVSGCPVADALFEAFPNVRHVFRMPRHVAAHLPATARTLQSMHRNRYDLVIDPDPRSQSGRLLALSARARHSVGYVGPGKSGALTHGVPIPTNLRHKAMTPIYLLRRALGEDPAARPWPQPSLMLTDAERERGRRILHALVPVDVQALAPLIGVFANATGDKLLAPGWWLALTAALPARMPGCRIAEILPASGKSLLEDRFPCFYSSDIRKLAAVLANLDAYVSADCGLMHLAWAAGVPTLGLFNVTDPAEWGPFGPGMNSLEVADATPEQVAREISMQLRPLTVGSS